MEPLQILLIIAGLFLGAGGIVALFRASRDAGGGARSPYIPFAMTAIGLMIAYRGYSDYYTLQPIDFVIMFAFVLALLSLLGVQFFIVDKHKQDG